MDKIILNAKERTVLGKKVKKLRKDGILPGHVFGNKTDGESVAVVAKEFMSVFHQAGETGLIDLKISKLVAGAIAEDRSRPVLIRDVQYDPRNEAILNIDFYQVNLKEKVKVPVPLVLVGEQPESVHMGETVVLQNLSTVEVEALPGDLVENIEVNIEVLKNIDDSITVSQLNYDGEKLTVLAEGEEVVVKLAPAVTEEMKALLEEQEAEAEAAAAEAVAEEGGEAPSEEAEIAEGAASEDSGPASTGSSEASEPKEAAEGTGESKETKNSNTEEAPKE